ncbi:MAG TPA: TonB-dependent receptor plug domain-containing protein, partial [Longimicrobiales bacterium]|nr:TonB-dependent receptor plug domain-containing protein [Longimicrobiales bacterium]
VGTNLGALTNQEGRYLIRRVPAGEQTIRGTLIGYGRVNQTVNVPAGGTVDLNFTMRESAIELEGVVVTTTGQQQRRREVGSTVDNINAEDVNLGPVQSFSQMMQGRAPNVTVLQSAGTSGTGARIRIRGSNSISLSNEPMLIVDGIQVDNSPASFAIGVGGQSISRLNDINPEDIQSIEVLKGPAASALYGTAAANGVIQITTKQGRSGDTQWNVYTEGGGLHEVTDYPANFQQLGTFIVDGEPVLGQCTVFENAAGDCTPTELNAFNPLEDVSPFRDGTTFTVGANVRGGSEQVRFFVSAEREDEEGIYESNWVERNYVRGNMDAALRDNLDLSFRAGYTNSQLSLPGNDNNTFGFIGAGLLGSAVDTERTRGYFAFPNSNRFALERIQNLQRLVGTLDLDFRPRRWLTFTGTAGLDLMNRDDESGVAPNIWLPTESPDQAIGNRFVFAGLIRNYTARANAIANYDFTPDWAAVTTVGGEFRQNRFQRTDAGGYNLLPGTRSLGALSERFEVDEFDQTTRTVSGIFSQQVSWMDRVYLTGALRGDRNSNFGGDLGFQWYPSVSASWVVAEEPWFPDYDALSSFRLRGAWGRSGLMPDFRSAEQFYSATVARFQNVSVPAITIGGAGNPELEAEKSTEYEFGV